MPDNTKTETVTQIVADKLVIEAAEIEYDSVAADSPDGDTTDTTEIRGEAVTESSIKR